MAIKKRTPQTDAEREAAIAAFGAGATPPEDDAPTAPAAATSQATRPPKSRANRAAVPSGDVPSTSLVRWADEDLPRAIQRIAAAEDRSFHKTMLQLLRQAADAYNAKK